MSGGKIIVKKNAGIMVGYNMCGGEIRFEGGHGWVAIDRKGGKIYHKGKLVRRGENNHAT
jgi:formylmethanofuran dehydrogenase subunit C